MKNFIVYISLDGLDKEKRQKSIVENSPLAVYNIRQMDEEGMD